MFRKVYLLLAVLIVSTMTTGAMRQNAAEARMSYVDSAHRFTIKYPNGFVVEHKDVSKIAPFSPKPLSSIFFMNPTMASGDLSGIEPPDLEIRVYEAKEGYSLEGWLDSVASALVEREADTRPYKNGNVSGLQICRRTMIAPGCSVYVLGRGRVYQLTPSSVEGELMISTFALTRE